MTKPGSDMHGRVADKVAIVTGAGRGIGRAALDRLAAEGANVVGIDINQDDLDRAQADLDAAGLAAAMYCGDATEESHAARLVEFANERFGPVDILVNNIGTTRAGRIWEMAVDDWDYIIRTNLRSAFLCTRAVAPQMIARRSGRIVNLSSGAVTARRGRRTTPGTPPMRRPRQASKASPATWRSNYPNSTSQ
ncbi:SDR family NAD(P)-dependent oxidoreductase [Sphingobium fuliginis]|uniref:SDR family NAD(P)-dependent oxidoreductase n=1 Tax=Sphingobium fuliginis (strain ATCC 27551) TaxID=336203 RepID=UPI0003F4C4E2|nr:SDR family NAD(P)-dependent oxidoreductase [Sphingobium fuliginis]